jgi:hypothetical protein
VRVVLFGPRLLLGTFFAQTLRSGAGQDRDDVFGKEVKFLQALFKDSCTLTGEVHLLKSEKSRL